MAYPRSTAPGSRYGYGRSGSTGSKPQQQTSSAWAGKWKQASGSAKGTSGYQPGTVRKGLGKAAMGAPAGNVSDAQREYKKRLGEYNKWQAQAQAEKQRYAEQAIVDTENARIRNLMNEWAQGMDGFPTGPGGFDFSAGGAGGGAMDTSGAIADASKYAGDATALRGDALAAALQALTAEFDLQEGQYGAEQDTFKGIFDREQAALTQGRGYAEDATFGSAADRGILRSGILKTDLTRADQPYADREATNIAKYNPEEGDLGSEYRRIESAIKLLGQQESAQKKEAEIASEKEQLSADQQLALLISGLGG